MGNHFAWFSAIFHLLHNDMDEELYNKSQYMKALTSVPQQRLAQNMIVILSYAAPVMQHY